MPGKLFGSQYRTTAPKSMRIDFFSLSAGAGHGRFLTSLHYAGFVCTNEWSCSPVTDLKRLITTDSCRNSLFAQEIKMCVLEPKKQTVRVKHTEVDEKTPTNFSGTRNSPLLLVANGCVPSCLLALWLLSAALRHAGTATSGVRSELTSQSGLLSTSIPTFFCTEIYTGHLMNEKNIWSHNHFYGLHGAELRWLFRAKCTRTILLSALLLECSISIPKCVEKKR